MIDRGSPVPFYFQLAQLLQQEIASGRWEPGERIPSEPALCRHYRVSRSTVRQALQTLGNDGLVTRAKGRGTFVAHSRPGTWLLQSPDGLFHEEVDRLGRRVTSQMLRAKVEPLPGWAAAALQQPEGADGVVIERLRSVDDQLAVYVVNHVPGHLADGVLPLGEDRSLYESLARSHGLHVQGGRRSVQAVKAGRRLARMLDCEPSTPLAFIESVSWDHDLVPFDCYRAWLRTDRLRIDIAVAGPQSALAPEAAAAEGMGAP